MKILDLISYPQSEVDDILQRTRQRLHGLEVEIKDERKTFACHAKLESFILDRITDGVVICNPDGVVTFCNRAGHDLLSKEKMEGKVITDFIVFNPPLDYLASVEGATDSGTEERFARLTSGGHEVDCRSVLTGKAIEVSVLTAPYNGHAVVVHLIRDKEREDIGLNGARAFKSSERASYGS